MDSSLVQELGQPCAPRNESVVSARATHLGLLGLLLACSVWALLFLASGTNAGNTWISIGYGLYSIAAPALVGVLWWQRRPASRIGSMLVLLGVLGAIGSWQASALSLPFSIGVLAQGSSAALALLLCLGFPTGRLEGRAERLLMLGILVALLATFAPWFVSGADIFGNNPLFRCRSNCPSNAFQLTGLGDEIRGTLATFGYLLVSMLGLATLGITVARIRKAPGHRRRSLTALALSSMLIFPAAAIFVIGSMILGPSAVERTGLPLALALALMVFPLGFAVPLIQSDLIAGNRLQDLLGKLAERPSRAEWRTDVAAALEDPDVRLGYWDDFSGRYLEPSGVELSRTGIAPDRLWIRIDAGDGPVAAAVTHRTLETEPELTNAVAMTTLAAVTTGHLEEARIDQSARATTAAETERHRLAREIQAGPQQRLAALRVHVNLLGEHETARREKPFIDEVGRSLDITIRELAEATRAQTAGHVTHQGLGAALRAERRGSPIAVRIVDRGLRRHPPRSELAVYYCALEGIQNSIKHGGGDASVTIRLFEADTGIGFVIEDNGVGFDSDEVVPGSGLQNIRERVSGLGGTVSVTSRPGSGTVISGRIPDSWQRAVTGRGVGT